jgi:hypothetical protein
MSAAPSVSVPPDRSMSRRWRSAQPSRNFRVLDQNSLLAVFPDELAQRAVEGRERLCDLYVAGRADWEVWRS